MNAGDTAWLLVSAALVLLMTPALALFYGGMVRKKNVLSTIMHSLSAIPLVTVVWVTFGYSLAFGKSHSGLIGGFEFVGLRGLDTTLRGTVPSLAFVAFQMMFAVITPALISGAFAERMKFSAYVVFVLAWSTFVYVPVAHWVWAEEGWLFKLGAQIDFSGLDAKQKRGALEAANAARCNCGCGMTLAQCVATDSTCPIRSAEKMPC